MKKIGSFFITASLLLGSWTAGGTATLALAANPDSPQFTKTSLLSDKEITALASEISGLIAKDTVTELSRMHRVQGSSGYARAAEFIAAKAREYGLDQVEVEKIPADGEKTYYTLKSAPGWDADIGELWEVEPHKSKIADYQEMRVALADYSQSADVTGSLIDVGAGTATKDYEGKEVKGQLVLAGGNVAAVHKIACDQLGAAGILSYQQNQLTGWSGDYVDNVRWGHLSPYNPANKFAFMISLRRARQLRDRLGRGEQITLRAIVKGDMHPSNYGVVSAIIPGTESPNEEIIFSCHLCHQKPGANDNASGAAAILEAARALNTLIRRGEIERPRRTIRFIWPPEISGTVAYFAQHSDVLRRMKAVIHCDMVGGNYDITKSVLHVTHTPASLPSCVNTVADIFAQYVMSGSLRAASGGGGEDALISPEGSKDSLVADITPYEMGSDHDVYQEGSFRVPAIYLRDWPDVFIHTNNDLPSNIDATKIKRSTFIAAACGYFLARAGSPEATRLADEVFSRALAGVPRDYNRARALELTNFEGSAAEARSLIAHSVERNAEAISSVTMLAPDDRALQSKTEALVDKLSGAWLVLTGQLSEQRKGKRTVLVLEPRELPKEPKENKSRSAKEASRPRSVSFDYSKIPTRKILGPMNVYYYDYVADHASPEDMHAVEAIASRPGGEVTLYEILNLVDGKRSIQEIRDYIAAAYGQIPIDLVSDYLRLLDKIGVVRFE
jgi:aminopeptidase YwaD